MNGRRSLPILASMLAILPTAPGCDAESARGISRSEGAFASAPPAAARIAHGGAEAPAEAADAPSATLGRKIIYNADVELVTEDLGKLDAALSKLIADRRAYVADSDRSGDVGATRRGTWRVRVPVDAYDGFLKSAVALGELVRQKANSQDVSEEFFDTDARVAAKKVEEARLLKHLSDSTGKLEEILTVERELSRVRGEIERMQGRLRALANLSSLATVTITATEIKGYVPSQAPTLGARIARSFQGSLDLLRRFGEDALIVLAGLAPWLPLIALGLWLVVKVARRLMATA